MAEEKPISSLKDPRLAEARLHLGQTGGKKPSAFLAEGAKMVHQALEAGSLIEDIFFLEDPVRPTEAKLLATLQQHQLPYQRLTKGIFFRVLGLGYETATRVMAVVQARPHPLRKLAELVEPNSHLLVCEQIQDPRNVGVLIRTANALGASAVIFAGASADPYSRASVRSSTGSILYQPVVIAEDLETLLSALKALGVFLIGTSAQATEPLSSLSISRPCALLVGNETHGLSATAQALCNTLATIPMSGTAHSLNVTVAAGIGLYGLNSCK